MDKTESILTFDEPAIKEFAIKIGCILGKPGRWISKIEPLRPPVRGSKIVKVLDSGELLPNLSLSTA